jgi:hypothetical protein
MPSKQAHLHARVPFAGLDGDGGERLAAQVHAANDLRVPDAAVDYDALGVW